MRCLLIAASVATLVLPAVGRAQEPQPSKLGDRLILSAGLGWTPCRCQFTGGQLRAEYSLTPLDRVVGLRVHLGGFWTPTQRYSVPSAVYGEGSTFEGVANAAQVDWGVTGSITPWPRGRVSPYIVAGVATLHGWNNGSGYFRRADGTAAERRQWRGGPRGLALVVGAGLRLRVGGRLLQFELRQLPGKLTTVGIGTVLPF
jgi:hypothetical protein